MMMSVTGVPGNRNIVAMTTIPGGTIPGHQGHSYGASVLIIACTDGTIWQSTCLGKEWDEWKQLPKIPY